MSRESYMKKPCKHCAFRKDVIPFLHADRADEITSLCYRPYSSFPCHKTTVHSECDDSDGEMIEIEESKQCFGFVQMKCEVSGDYDYPEGFEVSDLIYTEPDEMVDAYNDQFHGRRR